MWRVKNIMELSDKYVMKSLCRRAAIAESRRDAALSAVGAFTRLWFRNCKEGKTAASYSCDHFRAVSLLSRQ